MKMEITKEQVRSLEVKQLDTLKEISQAVIMLDKEYHAKPKYVSPNAEGQYADIINVDIKEGRDMRINGLRNAVQNAQIRAGKLGLENFYLVNTEYASVEQIVKKISACTDKCRAAKADYCTYGIIRDTYPPAYENSLADWLKKQMVKDKTIMISSGQVVEISNKTLDSILSDINAKTNEFNSQAKREYDIAVKRAKDFLKLYEAV